MGGSGSVIRFAGDVEAAFERNGTWSAAAILAALLVLSLFLNLTGIGFGLPQLTHWDERWIAQPAMNLLKTGKILGFNEEQAFHYPHLYIYAQAADYALIYLWEHARGAVTYDKNGELQYYRAKIHNLENTGWWSKFYLSGRALTALIGVASVVLVFAIGLRLHSRVVGLTAAGALAVSPLFVANSHYITVNVPAAFLSALALFIALRLFKPPPRPVLTAALAGFVGGLATSTKYNAVAVLAVVLLAVALTQRGGRLFLALMAAPAAGVIGFYLGTPQALETPTIFLQDLAQQIVYYRFHGHAYTEQPNTLLSYLVFLFTDGLGVGLSLLALLGIYGAIRRFGGRGVVVVAMVAIFLLGMGANRAYFTRNLTIIAPELALLCGFGIFELTELLRRRKFAASRFAAACAVVLLALPSLWGAWSISSLLASPNNFIVAADWIEENLPKGSKVLIEHSDRSATVPISEDSGLEVDTRSLAPGLSLGRLNSFDYVVTWTEGPHRVDRYRYGIPPFLPGGYDQVQERKGGKLVERWKEFTSKAELIKEFNPFELGTQGPTIQVWKTGGVR